MTRAFISTCGVCILLASPLGAQARSTVDLPTDAPARYDTDLLPPEFHRERRDSVLESLPDHALAVIFSNPVRNRTGDVDYQYRQSSDLYYLTGMTEPNSVLLLSPRGIPVASDTVSELLFVPERDPAAEVWNGRRLGTEGAQRELGLEAVLSNAEYDRVMDILLSDSSYQIFHLPLPQGVPRGSPLHHQIELLLNRVSVLHLPEGHLARQVANLLLSVDQPSGFARAKELFSANVPPDVLEGTQLEEAFTRFLASSDFGEWASWKRINVGEMFADALTLREILTRLRTTKTPEEIELMGYAIDVTATALREAIKSIEPGMYEYEVQGLIEYIFRKNGAEGPGFPSIVGSGENSVILHYESNRRQMQAGDMVVMDVGAEYHGYSADVTRTVPVNGSFTNEQRTIYRAVLDAADAALAVTEPGVTLLEVHRTAQRVLADRLLATGLISRPEDVRRFFLHATSHYLGLEVHDVGQIGRPLAPGTVFTIEPGIYISPAPDIDPRWWNIGVRIEDDILVTEDGAMMMSGSVPRKPEAIIELMSQEGLGNLAAGETPDR